MRTGIVPEITMNWILAFTIKYGVGMQAAVVESP